MIPPVYEFGRAHFAVLSGTSFAKTLSLQFAAGVADVSVGHCQPFVERDEHVAILVVGSEGLDRADGRRAVADNGYSHTRLPLDRLQPPVLFRYVKHYFVMFYNARMP